MTDDDMQHAPHCHQLVIVRTEGYSVTVHRCDECGAISTERHGATTSTPPTKAQ